MEFPAKSVSFAQDYLSAFSAKEDKAAGGTWKINRETMDIEAQKLFKQFPLPIPENLAALSIVSDLRATVPPSVRKRRRNFLKNRILEKIALRPHGPHETEWRVIQMEFGGDDAFFLALSRALLGERKIPLFSPKERILIENWSEVKIFDRALPGLKHWRPSAICDFFSYLHPEVVASASALSQAAKELGLRKSGLEVNLIEPRWSRHSTDRITEITVTFKGGRKQVLKSYQK